MCGILLDIKHARHRVSRNAICKEPPRNPSIKTMSEYTTNFETIDTLNSSEPGRGLAAHEDLTIAQHLDTMSAPDQHRPGERCYFNENGERRWVAVSEIARFLRKHGAKHPSDFEAQFRADWKSNFFSGF